MKVNSHCKEHQQLAERTDSEMEIFKAFGRLSFPAMPRRSIYGRPSVKSALNEARYLSNLILQHLLFPLIA